MPQRALNQRRWTSFVEKETGHSVRAWIKVFARLAAAELDGVEPELGRMIRRGKQLLRGEARVRRVRAAERAGRTARPRAPRAD